MSLGNALSYLTVLPIPFKKHLPLSRSVHFFPLVGLGMGSVLVFALLLLKAWLPAYLACLGTVALLEALTGGRHLRAVAELAEGRRTYPGSGFAAKADFGWKGTAAVASTVAAKALALSHVKPEWQAFAVLLAPVLGRSSQALGIIFSRHRSAPRGPEEEAVVKRRRKRALAFVALMLAIFFLFPWKAALVLMAQYFLVMVAGYRYWNRRMDGLTVQTMGAVAEAVEVALLVCCALLSLDPRFG